MTQDDAVAQAQGGISDSLKALYQAGVDSVVIPPVVGADADEQAKIDAAVAPLQAKIDQLSGQIAAVQTSASEVQAKLDAEVALEQADQGVISQLKGVLSQIAALAAPAPVQS